MPERSSARPRSIPDVDTTPLLLMCQYFSLDSATSRWYQLPEPIAQQRNLQEAVSKVAAWLRESDNVSNAPVLR